MRDQGIASHDLIVVGIGASSGGLEACRVLLSETPADTGLAFIIVMHLSPSHESRLAELLQPSTSMPVRQAEHGMRLEPDHVYVIAPDATVSVSGGTLAVDSPMDGSRGHVVDQLFESLPSAHGRVAAVVLSGSGSDGSHGIVRVRRAGGLVIAQRPDTAEQNGMPQSAIDSGVVDRVLPLKAIPGALVDFKAQGTAQLGSEEDASPRPELNVILDVLGDRYGVEFRDYKVGTLTRRVERRVGAVGARSWSDYLELLRASPEEAKQLFDDILIGVTEFFRDPEVWELFEHTVAPRLVEEHDPKKPLRVWVPACARGEEVYTVTMILRDLMTSREAKFPLQVFGTDLNADAIAAARAGLYPADVAERVSPTRLERYFRREGDQLRVGRELRESITFSVHNLLSDPPFAKLDLISCRNLLIYLLPRAHDQLAEVFHFALRPNGFLLLGRSESLGRKTELFEPVDKISRIYRRAATTRLGWYPTGRARPSAAPFRDATRSSRGELANSIQTTVLNRYVAPSVVVNRALEILYFFGSTKRFLEQPAGEARLDLLSWAPPGLYGALRRALDRVLETGERVTLDDVPLDRDGTVRRVRCVIEPLPVPDVESLIAVVFEESALPSIEPRPGGETTPLVDALQKELERTQDELHRTVDELRRVEEDYRADHEEGLSLNEELQSGNEELQTSKEELQSMNEELETVNRQLQETNDELHSVNDDLTNLFESTDIPVLFLDSELRVRRLTPASTRIAGIRKEDVGRPVEELRLIPQDEHLLADARAVLRDHEPRQAEVCARGDRWFSRVARPYRVDGTIVDGVCVTFVDITEVKRQAAAIEEERRYAEAIIKTMRTPMLVLDKQLRVRTANEQFYRTFPMAREEAEGRLLYELSGGAWDIPVLRELLERLLPEKKEMRGYEVEHDFAQLGHRVMRLNAYEMERQDKDSMILLVLEDISHARKAEHDVKRYADELARASVLKDEFLAMLGHELRNPLSAITQGVRLLDQVAGDEVGQKKIRALLERQTKRLSVLVDQLLDVSRVISGKVTLSKVPVDMRDIGATAVEDLRHLFEGRQHVLQVRLPPPGEAIVCADAVRLTQVIENLLGNANKYTNARGNVWLDLSATGEEVTLRVRDDGMGISADLLPRVFEPFTQESRALGRSQGGLGLGLPLVKSLVEMHGGSVRATSDGKGRGSEVVVTLPRFHGKAAQERAPSGDGEATAPPRRVLIIEDEGDLAEVLAESLRRKGHEVSWADRGAAGVAAVEEFRPDVIFLDIGLPDVDGYDVAREIRARHRPEEVRLIALSGYTRDERRLAEAGIDEHLLKPPSAEALERCLELSSSQPVDVLGVQPDAAAE